MTIVLLQHIMTEIFIALHVKESPVLKCAITSTSLRLVVVHIFLFLLLPYFLNFACVFLRVCRFQYLMRLCYCKGVVVF